MFLGHLPLTKDTFFDLDFLRFEQSNEQLHIPDEYDDIIPDHELGKMEAEPPVNTAEPDSVYNIGKLLYK